MHSVVREKSDGSETITVYGLAGPRGASSDHPDYVKIKEATFADKGTEVERLFTGAGIFLGKNYEDLRLQDPEVKPKPEPTEVEAMKAMKTTNVKGLTFATFAEPVGIIQEQEQVPPDQQFQKYLRAARARKRSPRTDIEFLTKRDGRPWIYRGSGEPSLASSWRVVAAR